MESRITDLEIKVGLSDDMLETMNHTLYRQQQQLDALQREVRALRLQLQTALPAESSKPADELPPHY